jgi:hypothetical protein
MSVSVSVNEAQARLTEEASFVYLQLSKKKGESIILNFEAKKARGWGGWVGGGVWKQRESRSGSVW